MSKTTSSALLVKKALQGKSFPLGSSLVDGGVNFCVFSKHATGMDLVLFPKDKNTPVRTIPLDPETNRTYYYWHIFVPDVAAGQEYGFRAYGPNNRSHGLLFDSEKLLLDPYCRAVAGWDNYSAAAATAGGGNLDCSLRSVVVDLRNYDWEDDQPIRRPYAESVIYELHVGGFTRHPNSGVLAENRGTFAGLTQKIPYLKDLGVTAVELMPVQDFDPNAGPAGMSNYWGYNTVAFFAPHHGYCTNQNPVDGINEFRDMVKALHKAGIEVILDVVFNHTGEGSQDGPTQSFRGLDNSIYYLLDQNDPSVYSNYSGCGNSFNGNHPVVGRLILDSLRYWVSEMHVDGFRFDLAASLARDPFGNPVPFPPLLWTIESDPVLAGTKLIAEAWDAAGLYKIGWFINVSNWYAEWNGPFRDDVRRFIKGENGSVASLASRITGSSDIYTVEDRELNRSVNFITCHDGFTLHDLVSFNNKHNEANGEQNRDGADINYSWNCGTEGETEEAEIALLRMQQSKNLLTLLFISQGTPMMLMGDEGGRTQGGNNNAYCHDDPMTWFDWDLIDRNAGLHRFVQELISFTQGLQIFKQRKALSTQPGNQPSITWHGVHLNQPDFGTASHSLAFTLDHADANERLHVMVNSYWEPLQFELPEGENWTRVIDTSLASPDDICCGSAAQSTKEQLVYIVVPRSVVVLSR